MASRKLRTWVLCLLAVLGGFSLWAVASSVGGDHTVVVPNRRTASGGGRKAESTSVDEVPLGVAVQQLKGKINQLRRPVEALLHRLEEVSVDKNNQAKKRNVPQNFHLVWHDNAPRDQRIFVGLTSFDGLECRATINSLYAQAARPELIFVGVTEVHSEGAPSCHDPSYNMCNVSTFCPPDNIRRRSIPLKKYKGSSHAHYVNTLLFHGEQYVMFLGPDRIRFTPQWDHVVVEEYLLAAHVGASSASSPTVKTVLTGFAVQGLENGQNFSGVPMFKNCKTEIADSGPVLSVPLSLESKGAQSSVFEWRSVTVKRGGTNANTGSTTTPFASYQFLFGQRDLLTDVPADPMLKYFTRDEEDLLLSMKLYTHGYGFYVPRRSSVWVLEGLPSVVGWDKGKKEAVLNVDEQEERNNAIIRAGIAMGHIREGDVKRFPVAHPSLAQRSEFEGVGKLRTAGQFFAAVGLDIHKFVVKNVCT